MYNDFFNDMKLDFIALEAAVINYETVNNFDEILNACAMESVSFAPAMEGIGQKIKSGIKSIITAVKNLFIKIANAIRSLFGGNSLSKPEVKHDTPEYESLLDQVNAKTKALFDYQTNLYSAIGKFIKEEGTDTKQVVIDINTIINGRTMSDRLKHNTDEEALSEIGKEANEKYGKTVDKWRNKADIVGKHANEIKNMYDILCSKAKDTVEYVFSAWRKTVPRTEGISYEAVKKVLKEKARPGNSDKFYTTSKKILNDLHDLSTKNASYCDTVLHNGILGDDINRDDLKSDIAKVGFDVCKSYMAISKSVLNISTILTCLYDLRWIGTPEFK